MIGHIIRFSVHNKFLVFLMVLALVISGLYSMYKLPVDAVPDITNNQVQIVTSSPSLAPQEVEQFITFPVEMTMANIPNVEEVRSISRFGLSVVTVVFKEDVPILEARQFVKEQIDLAKAEIPSEFGIPEMMPITTGLGEIYQYTLQVDPAFQHQYSNMELRTIQDWIVKRQLMGTEGIIEVSSFGGFLKQYEVSVDPLKLAANNTTLPEVFDALQRNNQNSGASYIEKAPKAYYIRTEGKVTSKEDIGKIVVKTDANGQSRVLVRDVATVTFGYPPRFGAMTMDGKGETVGGITLMLKGANSSEAIQNVQDRIAEIQKSLPEGVRIEPYLDRSVLVGKAIDTVTRNLVEGGLIVVFVLLLLLGNFRAGLIVASVIPLALLFAFTLMNIFGVSANLMSLGAIDFGIVIDGAIIVVEGILHVLYSQYIGKKLTRNEMDQVVSDTSSGIIGSAAFGVIIIIVVFIPIMTLTGIEGKMFTPMAQAVSFAVIGALILSVTYVPVMTALFLKRTIRSNPTFADKLVAKLRTAYRPSLEFALRFPKTVLAAALGMLTGSVILFMSMGGEFIPTLDEGDMAMQVTIEPGNSLSRMIETTTEAERILKAQFPEVTHVVSKIGTAEIPTDPMAVEDADVMILLKDRDRWVSASSREELAGKMKDALSTIDWAQFDFTQPIQLRFNELISGSKTDVAIKIFGEDMDELAKKGDEIAAMIKNINGTGDVKVEQTEGLPQLMIRLDRDKLALYHLDVEDVNMIIRAAYAGENAGVVYEGERRFDLTIRLNTASRKDLILSNLFITSPNGQNVPLSEVAHVELTEGPMQVSREDASRRLAVGVNVRNRDIASYIEEVQSTLNQLKLKPGYYIRYGGQFENLQAAKKRLSIAVPAALVLIFMLLYFAFQSVKNALIIYSAVPLSAVGGVIALLIRDMPFSISAGVGFIALFGVAVLNGIVMISYFNKLGSEGGENASNSKSLKEIVIEGALVRLRPVIMTATVASLGFLPMAISTSSGAEVQKPLATVVIGGLITATLLTLIVLPVIYYLVERISFNKKGNKAIAVIALMIGLPLLGNAQQLTEQAAIDTVLQNNFGLKNLVLSGEKIQLEKRAVKSLGNTNVNYQFGQMNSSALDHYFELDQEIGNPVYKSRNAKLIDARTELNKQEVELRKQTLTYEVRLAWLNWAYCNRDTELIAQQIREYEKYTEKMTKRKEAGDVSNVELGLVQIYQSELEAASVEANKALITAENNLKQLLVMNPERSIVLPENYSFEWDPTGAANSGTVSEMILKLDETRVDLAGQSVKLHQAGRLPGVNLGFFSQSLDNIYGFNGLKVGVSIPLLNRSASSYKGRSTIEKEVQQNNLEAHKNQLELSYSNALKQHRQFLEMYNQYNESWKTNAEFLDETAQLELETGEIDYMQYVMAISKSTQLKKQRLNMLYQLKKSAIDVAFYSIN